MKKALNGPTPSLISFTPILKSLRVGELFSGPAKKKPNKMVHDQLVGTEPGLVQ